jgi:hypothetical protein
MARKIFRPLDFAKVKTYPLKARSSKVQKRLVGKPLHKGVRLRSFIAGLPDILAAQNLKEIIMRTVRAHRTNKTIVIGMGAHPIKVGLSPLIVDFMKRGIVSAVALNGAGIIHDFELALAGATSEDVAASLQDGSFGMAEETGRFLNDAINRGHSRSLGLGKAVGEAILHEHLPNSRLSILATGARLGIPVTVHVGIGTDIIHMHPNVEGAALGATSLQDFRTLTSVVATLSDGVFFNLGSAVILPEVFLKAVSLARNLKNPVRNLTTVNVDFITHYRPLANIVSRPTMGSGRGYHITGHLEIMVPLLFAAILDRI